MDLKVEWHKPIQLTKYGKIIVDEASLSEAIPSKLGVYFFSRQYGDDYIPFYIGETSNLRSRLVSHLKSKKIADVLRGLSGEDHQIKGGTRFFHFGIFMPRPAQVAKKCIGIIQRHMIRQAVEDDIPILNKNLTKYKTHSIEFAGGKAGRGWYGKLSIAEA